MWTFPTDTDGKIWPVNPQGQVHVPVGGLVTSDGAWGGEAITLADMVNLRDKYRLNTVRAFAGVLGRELGHPTGGPARAATPPTPLRQVVEWAASLDMIVQIHPTHAGWGGYLTDRGQTQTENWLAMVKQTIAELEGLHQHCWFQVFPEPGKYKDGLGIEQWPQVLDAARKMRELGWTGVISLPDHMWGQHGPITTLHRDRSGPLRFADLVREYLQTDSQIVINCESYGQAWGSGLGHTDRAAHCLAYVDAIAAELGLYVYVSDWDYRGAYTSQPPDRQTLWQNSAAPAEYGAHAWFLAANQRGNIGLLAWSLTPQPIPNEMQLTTAGWASRIELGADGTPSNLTHAGAQLYITATLARPSFVPGTPTPPPPGPDPDDAGWLEATVSVNVPPPPPPAVPSVASFGPIAQLELGDNRQASFELPLAVKPAAARPIAEYRITTPPDPSVGTATIDHAGVVVFTAAPGFSGVATFTVAAR